jgi:hypothetical protein
MSNPISRATLLTLFCFSLSGCSIGIKSTSLNVVPSQQEEINLLKSVGYVVHDEVHAVRGIENQKQYLAIERKSWIDALSGFTDQKNIFTMSDGKPANIIKSSLDPDKTRPNEPILSDQVNDSALPNNNPTSLKSDSTATTGVNSFAEFAKTHPIVDVYVKAAPEEQGLSLDDVAYGTFWISFLSFGITPAYLPIPYTASFTLSMPEEKHVPPAHWDYPYDRREFYWLPLLIPMEDYLATFDDANEKDTLWRTEEKRLLVLKFLQDAKLLLQEH